MLYSDHQRKYRQSARFPERATQKGKANYWEIGGPETLIRQYDTWVPMYQTKQYPKHSSEIIISNFKESVGKLL